MRKIHQSPLKKLRLGILKKFKLLLPEKLFLSVYYEYYTGKKLDLKNPVEFNAKIQWIKLYYRPAILTKLVDKYGVRDYVATLIGEQYLNSLIAVYNSPAKVRFSELPDQFVLKATHSCNNNLIVKDKQKLSTTNATALLYKWMSRNYYYKSGFEWAYKDVPRRIICEKLLEEPGKEVINDYKFYCFGGRAKFIQVDSGRKLNSFKDFYDLDWKLLPFTKRGCKKHPDLQPRPDNLIEMIMLSEKLAGRFPFVRVDFYAVEGKTIFGELTFYPGDGRIDFYPDQYNKIIGDYLTLPEIPIGQKHISEY